MVLLTAQIQSYAQSSTTTSVTAIAAIQALLLDECFIPFFSSVECEEVIQTQEQLDQLDSITVYDGDLYISGRTNLDYSPLDDLQEITGGLYFLYGKQRSIAGFGSLSRVDGEIEIIENENLTSVNAFANLESTKSSITMGDNPVLNQFTGLQNLQSIDLGWLFISNNPNLQTLSAFSSLETIGSSLNLSDFAGSSLPSFSALLSVDQDISISDMPSLTALPTFNSLNSARGFFITELAQISNIASFSGVNSISGSVFISDNPNLVSISGFTGLTTIGEDLRILRNSNFTTVTGFSSLSTVVGVKTVSNNEDLDCPTQFSTLQPLNFSVGNLVNCSTN